MTSTARIMLVDDFRPWRKFVADLLIENADWEIVGEASDGLEAVQKAEEFQPDLIVMDIGLPRLNGIQAATSIHRVAPGSKILFLSENRDSDIAAAALGTGGQGYVVKSDGANELLVAVEAVLHGQRFLSSRFTDFNFIPPERQPSGEFR